MTGFLAALATFLFHAPLAFASYRLVTRYLSPSSTAAVCRDTFLTFCILFRLETILLDLVAPLSPVVIFVAHMAILMVIFPFTRATTAASPSPLPTPWLIRIAGGWVAVCVGLALYRTLLLPDPYDSLTYHLMLPAHWFQSGTLSPYPTPFGDIALTYTPEAVESFFFATLLPTGRDLLARIGQLPFLLAGAHFVYELVRRGSRSQQSAWPAISAASGFLLLPELLHQGTGSMADVAATTFFLGGVAVLVGFRHSTSRAHLVYGGALLGMFLGSRFTSVPFLPIALLPALVILGPQPRRWLAMLVPLLLLGSFPYLRNLWLTGNPLYPLQMQILGFDLPGLFTREATLQSQFNLWAKAESSGLAPSRLIFDTVSSSFLWSGLGWLAAGVITPWLPKGNKTARWCAVMGLLLILGHLLLVPYNTNMRFLFPAWGLLVVSSCLDLGDRRWGRWMLLLGFIGLCLESLSILPAWHVAGSKAWEFRAGLLGVFAMGVGVAWSLESGGNRWLRPCVTVLGAIVIALTLGLLDETREKKLVEVDQRDRGRRYQDYSAGWQLIRDLPAGQRIAYAGLNIPYPLCGSQLQHTVLTVPLDGSPAGLLPHQHRERLGTAFKPSSEKVELTLDRQRADYTGWLRSISDARIDYLALYLPRRRPEPIELQWALQHPGRFELVNPAPDERLKIFRVK